MTIRYEVVRTGSISTDQIKDFLSVFNEVFQREWTHREFQRKYIQNPFGESILVIAYDHGKPVGIRGYWRNDLEGRRCYQLVDTGVIDDYRRRGIYLQMVAEAERGIESCYLYSFPNLISRTTERKAGYDIRATYYRRPFFFFLEDINQVERISDDYVRWIFIGVEKEYVVTRKKGELFLLKKETSSRFTLLGRIDESFAHQFETVKNPLVFTITKKRSLLTRISRHHFPITEKERGIKAPDGIPFYRADYLMNRG